MTGLPPIINPAQIDAATRADRAPTLTKTSDPKQARAAAESFEAFFLSQVLGAMFEGIKADGPFGGGHGEAVYRPMLLQEYAKIVSARGGVGIADAVMREILTTQEVGE